MTAGFLLLLGSGSGAPANQTVTLAPTYRSPTVNGPVSIAQTSVFVPDLATTLHSRAAPLALVADMDEGRARQFRDDNSDAGSASFELNNEDPDSLLITEETIVRFSVLGVPAFDAFMETIDRVTLSQDDERQQVSLYQGRGKVCIFEEALVYPSYPPGSIPREDDRTFDWTLPQYDDSGWGTASVLCTVAFAQVNWPFLPFATGWSNTGVDVVWSSDGSYLNALPGTNYFREQFTVATTGNYLLQFVADNGGTVYVDGIRPPAFEIHAIDDFSSTHEQVLVLSAGPHTVACVATNNNEPTNPNNPGGIAIAIYEAVDVNNTPGPLVYSTSATTKILVRPATVPGMTIGRIMRLVVDEAQARGAIPEVALAFTDTVDSNGNPWLSTPNVSTKVGTDLLTFWRELAGTYIDFWMPPGDFTLYACAKGERGQTQAVTLGAPTNPNVARTGNITKLTHRTTI